MASGHPGRVHGVQAEFHEVVAVTHGDNLTDPDVHPWRRSLHEAPIEIGEVVPAPAEDAVRIESPFMASRGDVEQQRSQSPTLAVTPSPTASRMLPPGMAAPTATAGAADHCPWAGLAPMNRAAHAAPATITRADGDCTSRLT